MARSINLDTLTQSLTQIPEITRVTRTEFEGLPALAIQIGEYGTGTWRIVSSAGFVESGDECGDEFRFHDQDAKGRWINGLASGRFDIAVRAATTIR